MMSPLLPALAILSMSGENSLTSLAEERAANQSSRLWPVQTANASASERLSGRDDSTGMRAGKSSITSPESCQFGRKNAASGVESEGSLNPSFPRQNPGRRQGRMTAEVHFDCRCEPPQPPVLSFRPKKGRFGVANSCGCLLHDGPLWLTFQNADPGRVPQQSLSDEGGSLDDLHASRVPEQGSKGWNRKETLTQPLACIRDIQMWIKILGENHNPAARKPVRCCEKTGRQAVRRTALSLSISTLACLCFSQASAPTTGFEHLFEGSPLIIGTKGAWIVQEPRILHTGQVGVMVFGPGDQAVIAARERVHLTEKDLADPSGSSKLQALGETVSMINVTTGAKRSVVLPRSDLRFDQFTWASSRIVHASASGPEWSGALLIDTLTGRSHPCSSMKGWPIGSGIPHIAALQSKARNEDGSPGQSFLELHDLSTSPVGYRKVILPPKASSPLYLTRSQTLICHAGRDGWIEVDLSNGASQPWQGDSSALTLWKEGLERTNEDSPPDLEAVVWGGDNGGLWITEHVVTIPRARGSAGAPASQPKLPSTYRPSLRLSKDADYARMHSSNSRVLFRAMGAAFCAEITKIDLAKAMELLQAHAKAKALLNGKLAATAAHIYAADYDDRLPISGGQATEAVLPYIKDRKILDMIVWTNLTGQDLTKIERPAEYQLGYVPGPGGRAVIFADGHVQWIPD